MFPTQFDEKVFSQENTGEEVRLDLSKLFFAKIKSTSDISEVPTGMSLFDEEPSVEELFQRNKEWLTPEEELVVPEQDETCNEPLVIDDEGLELFANSDFYEEGDKLSEFNLNYNLDLSEEGLNLDDRGCLAKDLEEEAQGVKIIDPTSVSPQPEPQPEVVKPKKKVGRKKIPTGMDQRKDVVLKKVLRKIRNYYWKDFQTCTKFPIKKRGKADDAFLKDCLDIYIKKVFKQDPKPGMVRTLSNLMCVKDSKKKENLIYQTLYKFSFTRFKKVTRNSNFRYLVHRYSENVESGSLTPDESIGLQMIINVTNKS